MQVHPDRLRHVPEADERSEDRNRVYSRDYEDRNGRYGREGDRRYGGGGDDRYARGENRYPPRDDRYGRNRRDDLGENSDFVRLDDDEGGRRTPERELSSRPFDRGGNFYGRRGDRNGGSDGYLDARRQQRLESDVSIWPPSPSSPERPPPTPEKKSEKRSSRHHHSSRSHRHSHRHHRDDDRRDRHRSRRHRSDDDDTREKRSEKRRKPESDEEEAVWVEQKEDVPVLNDDGEEVGPMPMFVPGQKGSRNEYGGQLLRGEGSAMAAFVKEGERIPRRGEIGLEMDEIERYEKAGYVMSGSRHQRMNAVRIRKENQVITAEEKRSLLKLQAEEKAKRENQIVSSFKELVDSKLAGQER